MNKLRKLNREISNFIDFETFILECKPSNQYEVESIVENNNEKFYLFYTSNIYNNNWIDKIIDFDDDKFRDKRLYVLMLFSVKIEDRWNTYIVEKGNSNKFCEKFINSNKALNYLSHVINSSESLECVEYKAKSTSFSPNVETNSKLTFGKQKIQMVGRSASFISSMEIIYETIKVIPNEILINDLKLINGKKNIEFSKGIDIDFENLNQANIASEVFEIIKNIEDRSKTRNRKQINVALNYKVDSFKELFMESFNNENIKVSIYINQTNLNGSVYTGYLSDFCRNNAEYELTNSDIDRIIKKGVGFIYREDQDEIKCIFLNEKCYELIDYNWEMNEIDSLQNKEKNDYINGIFNVDKYTNEEHFIKIVSENNQNNKNLAIFHPNHLNLDNNRTKIELCDVIEYNEDNQEITFWFIKYKWGSGSSEALEQLERTKLLVMDRLHENQVKDKLQEKLRDLFGDESMFNLIYENKEKIKYNVLILPHTETLTSTLPLNMIKKSGKENIEIYVPKIKKINGEFIFSNDNN